MIIVDKYGSKELLTASKFVDDKEEKFCRMTILRGIKELHVVLLNTQGEYYKVYLAPDFWALNSFY